MNAFDETLRSDSGMSAVTVINMYIQKDFFGKNLKLSEGNFYQGIRLHIIYFSLTDRNIKTVIAFFSVHLPSIQAH